MNFIISNQVSAIARNNDLYLYNWYNDIGVSIEKKYINFFFEKKIDFNESFKKENIHFLLEKKFIGGEQTPIQFYKEEFEKIKKKEDSTLKLIVMPAGYACNFRCKYCYEEHNNERSATKSDINKILEYIKIFEYQKISIEYFGGEPLLNLPWILQLQKATNNPRSTITTNGYNLTPDVFEQLVSSGVRVFQITLDGLEEDHNFLRPHVNKTKTWDVIINNLQLIKQTDHLFNIILRINFNTLTATSKKRRAFLKTIQFIKDDIRFSLIFRPIGLYSEVNNTTTPAKIAVACSNNQNYLANQYEDEAQSLGYLLGDVQRLTCHGGVVCYASKNKSFVIDTAGNILKCTLALRQKENIFGNIKADSIEQEKLSAWDKFLKFNENCTKCFLFFQCTGRACALRNFKLQKTSCSPLLSNEYNLVEKIIRQKKILKQWTKK